MIHRLLRRPFYCLLLLWLAGCSVASNWELRQMNESLKAGDTLGAYNHAAEALRMTIDHREALALFPRINDQAFAAELDRAADLGRNGAWDQAVEQYNTIETMKATRSGLQGKLESYLAEKRSVDADLRVLIDRVLAISGPDVAAAVADARDHAADQYYGRAESLAAGDQYRQASGEFLRSLDYVPGYRDAVAQAAKYKRLADEQDALLNYGRGVAAAARGDYRAAQHAFTAALGFVPDYRDAALLAGRYKQLADQADALLNYQQGEHYASMGDYRAAAAAFTRADGFVPGYRDALHLMHHYSRLADEQEASHHYSEAMNHLNRDEFAAAAEEFRTADRVLPGYMDARRRAHWSERRIAPAPATVQSLVLQEVNEEGVPAGWFGPGQHGRVEDRRAVAVEIEGRPHYDRGRDGWIYDVDLKLAGRIDQGEQHIPVAAEIDRHMLIHRSGHGAWEAEQLH